MSDPNIHSPSMELEPSSSSTSASSSTTRPEATSLAAGTLSSEGSSSSSSQSSSTDRRVRFVSTGENQSLLPWTAIFPTPHPSRTSRPNVVRLHRHPTLLPGPPPPTANPRPGLDSVQREAPGQAQRSGRSLFPPMFGSSAMNEIQLSGAIVPRFNTGAQATSASSLDATVQAVRNKKIYHLDRRYITGEFDYATPICVIKEVFETHGLNLPQKSITTEEQVTFMINEIIKTKTALVHVNGYCPAPDDHLPVINSLHEPELIARYTSTAMPNRVWKYRELMIAFLHLQQYVMANNNIQLPEGEWHHGPKTQEHPLSYDATLLYRICRYYGVNTSRHTSLDGLARLVRSLTMNTDTLRRQLQDTIQCLPKWSLVNTMSALCNQSGLVPSTEIVASQVNTNPSTGANEAKTSSDSQSIPRVRSTGKLEEKVQILSDMPIFNPSTLSMADLNTSLIHLRNPNEYILRILPRNHIEAILFTALVFRLNIIESSSPMLEYMLIQSNSSRQDSFEPPTTSAASAIELTTLPSLLTVFGPHRPRSPSSGLSYAQPSSPNVSSGLSYAQPSSPNVSSGLSYAQPSSVSTSFESIVVPPANGSRPRLTYTPVDPHFRRRYYKNPRWYDISATWTPLLHTIYTANELNAFVQQEGYSDDEILQMQPYELLQMSRTEPTFYYGHHPDCTHEHTPLLYEDVKELDPHLIVSYGIAELAATTMQIYSINELATHFNQGASFKDPHQGSQSLPKHAINKLKKMCQATIRGGFSDHIKNEYTQLLVAIDVIERASRFDNPIVVLLRDEYTVSSVEIQTQVRNVLTALLHAGMYMRGWQVPDRTEYPLKSIDTNYDVEHKDAVEHRSTESLQQFKDQLLVLPVSLQNKIQALPLMNFRRTALSGDIEFFASSSDQEGRTILDRINIIVAGNTTGNINSCIRMSSNWLCASAYFYMIGLRLEAPFNLQQLDPIT